MPVNAALGTPYGVENHAGRNGQSERAVMSHSARASGRRTAGVSGLALTTVPWLSWKSLVLMV